MGRRNKDEEGESQRAKAGPVRLVTVPHCSVGSLLLGAAASEPWG